MNSLVYFIFCVVSAVHKFKSATRQSSQPKAVNVDFPLSFIVKKHLAKIKLNGAGG